MPILTVIQNEKERKITFDGEKLLSELLEKSDVHIDMDCAGRGVCKRCTVLVNGKEELSCRYIVKDDVTVVVPEMDDIVSVTGVENTGKPSENVCLCLDIGTTTLALSLVSLDSGEVIKTKTASNPQRKYGADVVSRIDYCSKNSPEALQKALVKTIKEMTDELLGECGLSDVEKMYVAGNTTMLHLFFGVDCSCLGMSPYTPVFLESKSVKGEKLGLDKIKSIASLPGISAFVGADIVSGLYFLGMPDGCDKYNILVDLGTNAEIVLWNSKKYLCATAAAGPCFEGANIECGMSAVRGAVCEYSKNGTYSVIGDVTPEGICATGLIDVISVLLQRGVVDKSGYMEDEEFFLTPDVKVTAKDIREFQLAKSAVRSALECLIKKADITYDSIEKMYIAGGFSSQLSISNACYLGLVPKELEEKFVPVNNSCLKGLVKYALDGGDLSQITRKAEYTDIGADSLFSQLFFENMSF